MGNYIGPVLEAVEAPGTALIVWFVSGLVALCGALCYAELGTMLPMNGGESVYLYRAFGSLVSFTFEFVSIVVQKVNQNQKKIIIFFILGEREKKNKSYIHTNQAFSSYTSSLKKNNK